MPTKRRQHTKPQPKAGRPYMPGYGLPSGKKGLLPWSWAKQHLEKSHNYWVATTRPDGRPHVMVVWGLWLGGAFYFSTGRQSRKARNLTRNSACVIGTDNAAEAVIVEGIVREVSEVPLRRKFITDYELKYNFDMSEYGDVLLSLKDPVYAVYPSVVFGLCEKKTLASATRWEFES